MRGLYLDETVVGNLSGVCESIHAFANFHIDVILVDFVFELILMHNGCWNILDGDAHVFILRHRGVQVQIFDVHGHELGARGEEDAVEYTYLGREICCLGAAVACILNLVGVDGVAHTLFDGFFGCIGDDDLEVGGLLALWNLGDMDEMDDGLCPGCHAACKVARCEPTDFVGGAVYPQ